VTQTRDHVQAGFLMVRSTLSDTADRDTFEHWYAHDHAPLAALRLGARSGRRFWRVTDSYVHCALYEFASLAVLEAERRAYAAMFILGPI